MAKVAVIWRLKPDQGLLAFQEEAVKYIARIKIVSDDRPRRVRHGGEGALGWACTCARSINRGDDDADKVSRRAHEPVS